MGFVTYWQTTRMSRYWKGQLVKYFVLGVPAYRLRYIIPYTPPTVERFYRIMRLAIYTATIQELRSLTGNVEMDETLFGGKVPGKRGCLYLKEAEWRFNHRKDNLLPILRGLLNQSVNVHPV